MTAPAEPAALTRKDFASDQAVRWCPGCGDYAILSAGPARFCSNLDLRRENFVVISGIGCSSRFPYYIDTYGIHSDPRPRTQRLPRASKQCARPT